MDHDAEYTAPLIQPIRSMRLCQIAADQITDLIETGRLSPGDQLPSERDLVEQLQISRASIREALRLLERQGLIDVRPGKGAFVINSVSHTEFLPSLMAWFEEHGNEVLEVIAVREALGGLAVSLAVQSASSQTIARLRQAVERMAGCVERGELVDATHADREFHRLLYEASGNQFLSLLGDSIVETLFGPRHSILRIPGRAQQSLIEHEAIVDAISERSVERGVEAVHQHTASVREALRSIRQSDQRRAQVDDRASSGPLPPAHLAPSSPNRPQRKRTKQEAKSAM